MKEMDLKNYDDALKIISIIADDKTLVTYRPRLNQITGSVLATILLQQILYWWKKSDGKPFYKFKQNCSHTLYKVGDSWCEELGFTRYEFDYALKKIGHGIRTVEKNQCNNGCCDKFIHYWTTRERLTFYDVNISALRKAGLSLYVKLDCHFTKSCNPALDNTETTSETTSETTINSFLEDKKNDSTFSKKIEKVNPVLKTNKFLDYWNTLSNLQKHTKPDTKTYKTAVRYIHQLKTGKFQIRNTLSQEFKEKNKISDKWITKKWSEAEIKEGMDRLNLMFTGGYNTWMENKDKINKSLPGLFYNERALTSMFLYVMKNKPSTSEDSILSVLSDDSKNKIKSNTDPKSKMRGVYNYFLEVDLFDDWKHPMTDKKKIFLLKKLEAVQKYYDENFPKWRNYVQNEFKSFSGFAHYYRDYLENYAPWPFDVKLLGTSGWLWDKFIQWFEDEYN